MKNILIPAVVAGLLLLLWQTLSHTILNLHAAQEKYTPNHTAVLKMLGDSLPGEGQYFLPGAAPGQSMEAMQKALAESMGKPWAQISYHKSLQTNMGANFLRSMGINLLLGFLLVGLLSKMHKPSFSSILSACLSIGFMSFCFHPYATFIWYKNYGIWAELADSLIAFGLAGLWLGWWMTGQAKKETAPAV